MPLYDYKCSKCNKFFERQISIGKRHEPASEMCPNCGSVGGVSLVIGAPNMVRETPRIDDGFREVLHKIHERTPGSILKDQIR